MSLAAARLRRTGCRVAAALATLLLAGSGEALAGDWSWSVTPYLWATDVGVDVAIDDVDVVSQEIPIEELVKDVETIAQVRVEARHGAFGLFADLFDVTLSDDAATIALPNGAGTVTLEPEMGMTIFDLGGIWDSNGDGHGLQLLYGARLLDQRAEIDAAFELANGATMEREYEVDETLLDGLVGVRFLGRIDARWGFEVGADASTGGSELTWSAASSVGYTFGPAGRYTVTAGYRHMEVEFDTDEPVEAVMTLSGFVAGFRFAF
jgi:hypothetical protein